MAASQILSVLSQLPLSTLAPSGEKEQAFTSPECPLSALPLSVHFSAPAQTSEIHGRVKHRALLHHLTCMGPEASCLKPRKFLVGAHSILQNPKTGLLRGGTSRTGP